MSCAPAKLAGSTAAIKDVHGAPVGDTLTLAAKPAPQPLPGFQKMQPRVFAGLFPVVAEDYPALREALEKLKLNDAAMHFEPESSEAMGFGFRCGFLGMLHMEIVQERLEREYDLNLISTAPTVVYEILQTDGSIDPARQSGQAAGRQLHRGSARTDHRRQYPHAAGVCR